MPPLLRIWQGGEPLQTPASLQGGESPLLLCMLQGGEPLPVFLQCHEATDKHLTQAISSTKSRMASAFL